MTFEFLAYHSEDKRGRMLRQAIQYFWKSAPGRPILQEWRDCVFACRKPVDYVGKSFLRG